ncbi:MAG TPA: helix-turn-helix domain-containing protein [Candidatus Cloacimonadota bacterium]|nr:helix-turn-helix domain-containing protein [Candidatus Cloacimonadota bacterium]HQB40770.1 helix-turn-helix domain-containing protein [Candidatus Cloacimonadota bacterium]
MNNDDKVKTESIIFAAAMGEFLEKGYNGARMQAIADKAGINKALLHYYFKGKDDLYKSIFKKVFADFLI